MGRGLATEKWSRNLKTMGKVKELVVGSLCDYFCVCVLVLSVCTHDLYPTLRWAQLEASISAAHVRPKHTSGQGTKGLSGGLAPQIWE